MTDEPRRPPGRPWPWRRPSRESVPASGPDSWDDDPWSDDGDDGSAGVREPRRPNPLGPMSEAGMLPEPEPPQMISLPDPRH